MAGLQLKVQINDTRHTSIIVQNEETVKDIVEEILDKLEIDLKYETLCILLQQRQNSNYSSLCYTLQKTETVADILKYGNEVYFRIMYFPEQLTPEKIDDDNFLQLMFQQIHRLILMRTWACSDENIFKLAAIDCQLNLGDYHGNEQIQSLLKQIMPEDIISYYNIKQVEQFIKQFWSQQQPNQTIQQLQRKYLTIARNEIPQYGFCTFVEQAISINDQKCQQNIFVYLCISKTRFLVLDQYAQVLFNDTIKNSNEKLQNNILSIHNKDQSLEIMIQDIVDYNSTVMFLQKASFKVNH